MSAEATYYYCMALEGLGSKVDRRDAWEVIERAYIAPGRYYHNLQHIDHVVARIGDLKVGRTLDFNERALSLAAIYHDVVYIPGSDINEISSASFAAMDLGKKGLQKGLTSEVMRLINATTHESYDKNVDLATAMLLDADLDGLSSDSFTYMENSRDIRNEFDCTDDQWREGREAWIETFLSREHIYHLGERWSSEDGYSRRELDSKAWNNLHDELESLVPPESNR